MKKTEEMMRFDRDLKADPELVKKFSEATKEASESGTCKGDIEVIARAANSLGYEISMEEMERSVAEKEEMDPAEMAGGGKSECDYFWKTDYEDEYGHNKYCVTLWHCENITLHTETNDHGARCFSDYQCSEIYYCSYSAYNRSNRSA